MPLDLTHQGVARLAENPRVGGMGLAAMLNLASGAAERQNEVTKLQEARDLRLFGIRQQAENQFESRELRKQLAGESLAVRQDQIRQMEADRRAARELALDKQNEQQIQNTSLRMKEVVPVFSAAKNLNALLEEMNIKYKAADKVPGLGYLKNKPFASLIMGPEGKDVQAAVKLFGNAMLRAMSGQAVTAPEEVRNMAAMMASGVYSGDDFIRNWPRMVGWVNDQFQLSAAGLSPKARPVFETRTGLSLERLKATTFDSPAAAAKARAPRAGWTQQEIDALTPEEYATLK